MNTIALKQYPIFSLKFVKAYLITMRSYLMFVSGITGIVGMSFSTQISLTKTFLIFISSFFSYGFGQALTDCFQIDTDSLSSPYRPLTQGIVNRNHFLTISCIGLLFCISILTFYNTVNILLGTLAGTGLATYTFFKRKWWAGPFYNAWIVVVLFFMGYLAGTEKTNFDFDNPIFTVAVLSVFFGYANFVLTGYFKDIAADRVTNYNTLPVVYGRKISSIVSDVFCLIASASVLVLVFALSFDSFPYQIILRALFFIYGGIGAAVLTQINLHSIISDEEAHKAISPCVHSYILLLSGLTILNQPDWLVPSILFYLLYILTMKVRPAKEQI